jgi:hypothetical protein
MSVKKKILLPKDQRSKGSKGTTERDHIRMDDKLITIWRYTNKSLTKSKNWYVRCYLGGETKQKNTKTDDLKVARRVAKKWYGEMLSRLDDGIPVERIDRDNHLFDEVALEWLEECRRVSGNGKNKNYYRDHQLSYKNYIQPFFLKDNIEDINTPRLVKWQMWREKRRIQTPELLDGRLKKEYTTIFQILKYGVILGHIDHTPEKPLLLIRQRQKKKRQPTRATFTSSEYKKLLEVSRRRVKESKDIYLKQKKLKEKGKKSFGGYWEGIWKSRLYLHYFIICLSHTGVRPYELMRVRHTDIKMVEDKDDRRKHLEIDIIGKITDRKVISKYGGYFAYLGMKENVCPDHKPDDLVFPVSPRNGMRELLEDSGLRYSKNGDRRDSKSLRHFYIMTELQRKTPYKQLSMQIDVSEEVIRNHYGRHLDTTMFRETLIKTGHIQNP